MEKQLGKHLIQLQKKPTYTNAWAFKLGFPPELVKMRGNDIYEEHAENTASQ